MSGSLISSRNCKFCLKARIPISRKLMRISRRSTSFPKSSLKRVSTPKAYKSWSSCKSRTRRKNYVCRPLGAVSTTKSFSPSTAPRLSNLLRKRSMISKRTSYLFMRRKGRKYTFAYAVDRQYEEVLRTKVGIFAAELLHLLERGQSQLGQPLKIR